MMSILSWNCQEAASRDFYRVFMDMIRFHKPMLVGLKFLVHMLMIYVVDLASISGSRLRRLVSVKEYGFSGMMRSRLKLCTPHHNLFYFG